MTAGPKSPLAKSNLNINGEICEFAAKHNLSQRETDIFLLILNKITSSNEIGEFLGLSPNTVSNHLKNILTKCYCHSKTELLAKFLLFYSEKYEQAQLIGRPPRCAFLHQKREMPKVLSEAFSSQKIQIDCFSSKADFENSTNLVPYDAVISQFKLGYVPLQSRYIEVDENFKIVGESFSNEPQSHSPQHELNRLLFWIFEEFIADPFVKSRFLRINKEIDVLINGEVRTKCSNIGFGGMFVSLDYSGKIQNLFQTGTNLNLTFQLEDTQEKIDLEAEVMWSRKNSRFYLDSGIGVQFQTLDQLTEEKIKNFIRYNKPLLIIPDDS